MSSKYRNRTVRVDGHAFDSQAEARRYGELRLLEQAGEIDGLVCHPRYALIVNGHDVGTYEADFSYLPHGATARVVEDVKCEFTRRLPLYRLKRKLMKACHEIEVIEVLA